MAIDSSGELYAAKYGTGVVGYLLGASGAVSDYTWTGQGSFTQSNGVKIDAAGNLVVAEDYRTVWNVSWDDDTVLHQYQRHRD